MGLTKKITDAWSAFMGNGPHAAGTESRHGADHEAYRGNWVPIKTGSFNGEKTPGELGNVYDLTPSYRLLRLRAHEAQLTNDVISIITGKFFKWVIGKGLKMQSEPNEKALRTENIGTIPDRFRDDVESRFDVYTSSTYCDYKGMDTLNQIAVEAFKAAFFGDVLIVFRVKNGSPTVQLIDGEHVRDPYFDDKNQWHKKAKDNGHVIRNGIEQDDAGRHVAYFVATQSKGGFFDEVERIPAKGTKTKRTMATLFGLKKHRMDNDRFIPMITPILEKAAKLDRYTEATVGSAEERAKIPFSVEHNKESDGTNPLIDNVRVAAGKGKNAASETDGYELGKKTATNIAATTGKQVFNMPKGAQLKALYSQNEIQYEAFWKAVLRSLCAAIDIPPEVALQEYNSNYSASRAAIGGWEFICEIYRGLICEKLHKPFYQLWLHTEILKGKVTAPGYLQNSTNYMVVEAYGKARFIGSKMPHLDPVKEVKAAVEMVEKGLMSNEMAAEKLNSGDWYETQGKLKKEETAKAKQEEKKEDPKETDRKLKVAGNE